MPPDTRVGALRWNAGAAAWEVPVTDVRGGRARRDVAGAAGRPGDGHRRVGAVGDPGADPRRVCRRGCTRTRARRSTSRRWPASAWRCWGRARRRSTTRRPRSSRARARSSSAFAARAWSTSTPTAGPSSSGSCATWAISPTSTSGASSARSCAWGSSLRRTRPKRARAKAGFRLHAGCAWSAVEARGDTVAIRDRRRRDARGRLRHRRHRLRDRSGASARAARGAPAHRPLVGSLRRRPREKFPTICCATRTSGPASSTPRRCPARRRTCSTSTTTLSGAS